MKTLKFKCTLLSDVILNVKSASEGLNSTLDFIPGSNFLGIAAGKLYNEVAPETSMDLFHSGNVRFSDAHIGWSGARGFKAPAAIYHPKNQELSEAAFVFHKIPSSVMTSTEFREKQIKQLREGFFISENGAIRKLSNEKSFAVKSAYDKSARRSKDECMFAYESLVGGGEYYFSVELENESLAEVVIGALVGEKHIGRSRTAQYGCVKIEQSDYTEVSGGNIAGDEIEVYADGRLIFLDEYGMPHFRPSADELGLPGGDILWEKCQIRTFQYSPWNFKRQAFDADRCGIEKGSVFVVKYNSSNAKEMSPRYVGYYRNEGFGRVIYNPEFLKADYSTGLCKSKFAEKPKTRNRDSEDKKPIKVLNNSLLLKFIAEEQRSTQAEEEIYMLVNKFANAFESRFKGKQFASQWGQIRSIALSADNFEKLKELLLCNVKDHEGYLYHGIAQTKWIEAGRRIEFGKFIYDLSNRKPDFTDSEKCNAVINLASEMAKRSKK